MSEIAIWEFKAKCFSPLDQVQKTKKPIRITGFGKPVAEVIPASPSSESDWIGSTKDRVEILAHESKAAGVGARAILEHANLKSSLYNPLDFLFPKLKET